MASQTLFWVPGGRAKFQAPPPLLDWKVVQQKMPWNIVLLLGGGFALAKGSEVAFLGSPGICVFLGGFFSISRSVLSQDTRGHTGSIRCCFPQLHPWSPGIRINPYCSRSNGMAPPLRAAQLTVFLEKGLIKELPRHIKGSFK